MALHFLKSLLNSNDNKKSYDISLAPVSSSFNTIFDSITCIWENNEENKKNTPSYYVWFLHSFFLSRWRRFEYGLVVDLMRSTKTPW